MTLLEAQALSKWGFRGGRRVTILSDVSLKVERGEIAGLVGCSGTGKSTLLHILAGMLRPDEGRVIPAGRTVLVFQNPCLLPYLTVRENIELPALFSRNRGLSVTVARALESVGLEVDERRSAGTLSRGEAQRVAVARALMVKPSTLLLDEPTASLDGEASRLLIDLLLRLVRSGEVGALLATHDPEVAARCDRVLPIEAGRLVAGASPGP